MNSEVMSSEVVFHEFLKVEKSRVCWEQFDGSMGPVNTRYVVRRGDSVGIVPVCTENDRILLIKQFRFPARRDGSNGYLWEIPAGMVDGKEEPSSTARRELLEETGMKVEKVEYLTSYYLSPGLLDEQMHLYLARVADCSTLKRLGGNPDEGEDLLLQDFDREELFTMIGDHQILDAKTIAAILYYFNIFYTV